MANTPWAPTGFSEDATAYSSGSQKARVWTEGWMAEWGFCPSCGHDGLHKARNNAEVCDFQCPACGEDFELKSSKRPFGHRVMDGAYEAMIRRISAPVNPNLMLMRYSAERQGVIDLLAVPKQFLVPSIIQKRKPLAPTARRAGWVGCNILLKDIPSAGRVIFIDNGGFVPRDQIRGQWESTRFLQSKSIESRGWLLEVLNCVERTGTLFFTLEDIYRHESRLSGIFPNNNNVRPKIRQQLQVLRDHGVIEFLGKGHYRLNKASSHARD